MLTLQTLQGRPSMNILSAQKHHTDDILRLYQQLIHTLSALQPAYFKDAQQSSNFIHQMIADPQSEILLAVNEQDVVGFAVLQQQTTPPYPMFINHHYAYLLDLVVAEDMRQQGIAQLLLEACKTWTTSRQLAYLELSVLSNNQPALKLYAQQGFHTKMHTMAWTPAAN